MKRLSCVEFSDVSGTSTMRLVVGVISAKVEKEFGERNFGFDSLKSSPLNHDMEEKGIVVRDSCPGLSPATRINPIHCDTSTVNTSAWYRVRKLLRGHTPTLHLDPPLSYSLAFKDTATETARLWKAHCGTGS